MDRGARGVTSPVTQSRTRLSDEHYTLAYIGLGQSVVSMGLSFAKFRKFPAVFLAALCSPHAPSSCSGPLVTVLWR